MKFAMQYRRADALEKANAECWHDIEMAPPNAVRRVQEENLVAQMAYLKENSDFYRDILAQAGVAFDDIRTIEDLQKLPYTFKTDIRESLLADIWRQTQKTSSRCRRRPALPAARRMWH